jgi:predicted nucleotidyltransferase
VSAAGAHRLRSIPCDYDTRALEEIDDRMAIVARDNRVAIALAIESGSRAWGFPSPDSDFDCRFLFVRAAGDYLSPWLRRDVIETPLEGDFDVNGWDLGKALKLLLKGNAVVVEWLTSPIVYDGDPALVAELRSFAGRFSNRLGVARHYLHLGEKQRRTYFAEGKDIQLKKLFYALRPAAALRWLRLHEEAAIAPMHFPTLITQCEAPDDVIALSFDLIARKAVSRELGAAPLPEPIRTFVDTEFALARERLPPASAGPAPQAREAAEALFRSAVLRLDGGGSTRRAGEAKQDL